MKPKSYHIEIVINGVRICHKTIIKKAGWDNEMYLAFKEIADRCSVCNLQNDLDELIAKGVSCNSGMNYRGFEIHDKKTFESLAGINPKFKKMPKGVKRK